MEDHDQQTGQEIKGLLSFSARKSVQEAMLPIITYIQTCPSVTARSFPRGVMAKIMPMVVAIRTDQPEAFSIVVTGRNFATY